MKHGGRETLCLKDNTAWICLSNPSHPLPLKQHDYLKSTDRKIMLNVWYQYNACWWPDNVRRWVLSRQNADLLYTEYSRPSMGVVNLWILYRQFITCWWTNIMSTTQHKHICKDQIILVNSNNSSWIPPMQYQRSVSITSIYYHKLWRHEMSVKVF